MVRLGKTITQIYKQYILALQPSHKISNDFDRYYTSFTHERWKKKKKTKTKSQKEM
jgi:hypothetical protein